MKLVRVLACVVAFAFATAGAAAAAQQPSQPAPAQPEKKPEEKKPEEQQPKPEEPPRIEETVVVVGTKVEQKLVDAPATISVLTGQMIESSPSQSFADLMRSVPGLNVTQISARDVNMTSRAATTSLATGQLALLDGRSVYLDFFGFVMWDFLPVNFAEIKQIEVLRGPASAVWGANALHGVVNVITKSPREIQGTTATLGFGGFSRPDSDNCQDDDGNECDSMIFYVSGTHAQAVNDRWAFKLSAGAYTQDPLTRPTGNIPNGLTPPTPYPPFQNRGTTQPKFDTRFDYDHPDGQQRWTFGGGVAGTDGIMHSGIGPFDIDSGSILGYFKAGYSKGARRAQFFTNILNGQATNLLARDASGAFLPFDFQTSTFDVEYNDSRTFAARHVLTYGGNARYSSFDLSIAPDADSRGEGGVYVQDDIFLNEMFRIVAGGRLDLFSNIDAVFSPRVAFMIKPQADHTFRVSYNRAYRSPSVINEHLDATILNQATIPAIPGFLPNPVPISFPIEAVGNTDITEESLDAYEVGYSGFVAGRATLSAAFYVNNFHDNINFTQVGTYTSQNPPPPPPPLPGFPPQLRPILNVLNAVGRGIPCCFTYLNLGDYRQIGFELGGDFAINPNLTAFANYSWQDEPNAETDAEQAELNIPPANRVNVGLNLDYGRYFGNFAVSYQDEAFFQDVLDARFHGTTEAFTLVNAGAGVKFQEDRYRASLKIVNLFNEDVQQHIFGDILQRQVIGEIRVKF
jgi:outer membrane receptor protein involved in Fe transport